MDDQVKPLPADPTAAFHAEQAAKQEAYAEKRQRWADRLEQMDELAELAEEVTMPATPAPEAGSSSEGETTAPPAARQRTRRTSRRSIDPRQSCFQFYDE